MKVVTVEYRRLRSFGEYENETVGIVAELEPGQSPETTLAEARAWVDGQMGGSQEARDLTSRVHDLRWTAQDLERKIERATEQWVAIVAFLGKLGIEKPSDLPDTLKDLPF